MREARGQCECVDVRFDALLRHMQQTGDSICETLCKFHVGEMCAACLADAMLALNGTERDMHEYLMTRLPPPPGANR